MAAATTELRRELGAGKPAKKGTSCNCKADIERKLLDAFKRTAPDAATHKVALQGYGFRLVDNVLTLQPFMNFKFSADHPTKTGASRHRAKVGVMHFSYCPFCGKSLSQGR